MILLLLACSDQGLTGDKAPFQDDPLDTSGFVPPVDSADTGLSQELCNGVDDDGDGEVDEGFPDDDANGRADCMDQTCPDLDVGEAGTVDGGVSCRGGDPVADPWHSVILWQNDTPAPDSSFRASVSAPLVTQLGDDNGDGVVDGDDDPDVLLVAFAPNGYTQGTLVALDGVTGDREWSVDDVDPLGGIAAGDLDADGAVDVVYVRNDETLMAVENDGTGKWEGDVIATLLSEPLVSLVDWDADGVGDVYAGGAFYSGVDGSLLEDLGFTQQMSLPAFADLDGDGELDVVSAQNAFAHDGSVLWSTGYAYADAWVLLVQADTDPDPEVAVLGYTYTLLDTDGTKLATGPGSSGGIPTPPAVGDFDGDGDVEIADVMLNQLTLLELDGSVDWATPVSDMSTYAGSSGADLDGDGALEVLYGDEASFGVFDGRTGTELLEETGRGSVTIAEYPVPADVDHDGHLDALVVSSGSTGWGAVTALTMDGVGWAPGPAEWATHDNDADRVVDGRVATDPVTPWLDTQVIRAAPTGSTEGPDLGVAFTDACVVDCSYGPAEVAVQVWNAGGGDAAEGAQLVVYADDRVVGTETLPALPAGTSLAGTTFSVAVADLPQTAWRVEVNPADGAADCNVDDNVAYAYDPVCPR